MGPPEARALSEELHKWEMPRRQDRSGKKRPNSKLEGDVSLTIYTFKSSLGFKVNPFLEQNKEEMVPTPFTAFAVPDSPMFKALVWDMGQSDLNCFSPWSETRFPNPLEEYSNP